MATGFESNHEKLATIAALLKATRSLAQTPYKSITDTNEKAIKLRNHLKSSNGKPRVSTNVNLKNLHITLDAWTQASAQT